MGLFDDLIKKPTPPAVQSDPLANGGGSTGGSTGGASGGGNPGQPAFLIKKTEEQSIFSGSNVSAQPTAFQPASQPLSTGNSDDGNSLLVKSEPAVPNVVQFTQAEPTNTVTPALPISTPVESSSPIIAIEDPIISSPIIETQELGQSPIIGVSEPTSPSVTPVNESSDSLFDSLIGNSDSLSPEEVEGQALVVAEPAVYETPKEEASSSILSDLEESSQPQEATIKPEESFLNPKDFIQKSIENIDLMLGNIEKNHEAKIEEAKAFGHEKERFAELERKSYEEAAIMDGEKTHTLHMRKLFSKELEKDEEMRHKIMNPQDGSYVKTTMTGIEQAKKIEDVMGPRPHRAKKIAANDDSFKKSA